MPHDKHGNLVEKGDLVTVTARVVDVQPEVDACNLTAETIELMDGQHPTTLILNTRMVEKVPAAPPDRP